MRVGETPNGPACGAFVHPCMCAIAVFGVLPLPSRHEFIFRIFIILIPSLPFSFSSFSFDCLCLFVPGFPLICSLLPVVVELSAMANGASARTHSGCFFQSPYSYAGRVKALFFQTSPSQNSASWKHAHCTCTRKRTHTENIIPLSGSSTQPTHIQTTLSLAQSISFLRSPSSRSDCTLRW